MKIYHAGASVCSQKVRVLLAEKKIEWQSVNLDLSKGETHTPEFRKLNADAVVPVLVTDDDFIIRESSVIIEYLDKLDPENSLMPTDVQGQYTTRMWLIRCIEIHAAVASITFATIFRDRQKANLTPEQVEKWLSGQPSPQSAQKRREIFENGVASPYVGGALLTFERVFADMNKALVKSKWLAGDKYSMADIALIAYIDRIARLGLNKLWDEKYPEITRWYAASRQRPSFAEAITAYDGADELAAMAKAGERAWPEIKKAYEAIL